jgi:negative regulator of flagellin synthesis FlgM
MRVDLLSQVQQVYNVGKPRKTTGTNSISRGTDGVEISSIGRDIQTAKTAVKNSPDVRENRVAELKKKIASGTYDVSGESFAEKLAAKYNEAAGLI